MMRPGLLGPVSHFVMLLLILLKVVPPLVRLQSAVSWFQRMAVMPKISLAIAWTLVSVSP